MTASRRDFERPFSLKLTLDVRKIGQVSLLFVFSVILRRNGRDFFFALKVSKKLVDRLNGINRDVLYNRAFGGF